MSVRVRVRVFARADDQGLHQCVTVSEQVSVLCVCVCARKDNKPVRALGAAATVWSNRTGSHSLACRSLVKTKDPAVKQEPGSKVCFSDGSIDWSQVACQSQWSKAKDQRPADDWSNVSNRKTKVAK